MLDCKLFAASHYFSNPLEKGSANVGILSERIFFQVSGWESTNAVTVRALNKLKTSLDSAREADRSSAASAAAGARTNAEGVEALREEMEGVWASMEEGRQRVKQQGKDILEIKVGMKREMDLWHGCTHPQSIRPNNKYRTVKGWQYCRRSVLMNFLPFAA